MATRAGNAKTREPPGGVPNREICVRSIEEPFAQKSIGRVIREAVAADAIVEDSPAAAAATQAIGMSRVFIILKVCTAPGAFASHRD
jgi:hypothetical protein